MLLSCWLLIRYELAAAYAAWLSTEFSMHAHATFLVFVLFLVFVIDGGEEHECERTVTHHELDEHERHLEWLTP